MKVDSLIKNVNLATMVGPNAYGALDSNNTEQRSAVAIKDGLIQWLGRSSDAESIVASSSIDGGGQWLTPGLIDCHTHLVYGGHRADEFELKLQGASYEEISRRGGGIVSTVNATRRLSEDELFAESALRLKRLMCEGITTVEIKSGYGLNLQDEVKMLRVARRLGREMSVNVKTTFLAAHALPPEYSNKDEYIDFVISDIFPVIVSEGLADAVDFFCEGIGFTRQQCQRICEAAGKLGLPIKGHVEQLSNLQGAQLVAEHRGLSVDHLEYLNEADVPLLKRANVVAVLLPGAFYYLGETQLPPIDCMVEQGLPIAIASDLNPGSSPIASILNVMNLACSQFKLTPEAVIKGVTVHAAQALGMQDQLGCISVGYKADLLLWPVDTLSQLCYGMNLLSPSRIIKDGKDVAAL